MTFGKRLKAVIKEERYSQRAFAEVVGIPLRSIENYLSDRQEPTYSAIVKIVTNPKFSQYTMWLLNGRVEPDSGQVCPDFSTQEQCGLVSSDSQKKA
ncbi:helix-turn-helix domain-containing protein [Photobacterium damselae]|uniref:helix-turn-helix domain-containing protein n=1 Tax=Photobacterium damselae TaxID=38293 RepID=UPI00083AF652|nr:helix-turn-helix transcriptional regulator [Photobacterium damselae]PSB88639.1 XRE family transcriptional regulator [Photobacterium damselae subsp. damselae]QSH59320.1 helix-turn-helix transcriptional regulator [Photobacterium damselae subsp. damselae]UKA30996.1 helix-turn-helix transcriptional regulator [Photobacterium damselae subsp. damselae]